MKAPRLPAPGAIGLALALLLMVAGVALWAQRQAAAAADWREHTLAVRLEIATLRADVAELPRNVNGYLISGQPRWLDPYREAAQRIPGRLQALRGLTADNPAQQARLQELDAGLAALLRTYGASVELAARAGLEAGRRRVATGEGRDRVLAVNARLDALDAEELRLLRSREARARRRDNAAAAATLLGSGLSLALFAWAARGLRRSLAQQRATIEELTRTQASLRDSNEALRQQGSQLADLNEALWKSVAEHQGRSPAGPVSAPGGGGLDDPARLAALRRTGLLDSAAEDTFDRFTRLAAQSLQVPVCLISLVDDQRQFFKSAHGLPEPWAGRRGTPLSHSFCQHVVTSGGPLVVEDAAQDPRVRDNGAVRDLGVAAYLGVPLATPDGQVLGSFCAIDTHPHAWSEQDRRVLERIAQSILASIALRMQLQQLEHRVDERTAEVRMLADAIEQSLSGFYIVDADGRFTYANAAYCRMWGCDDPQALIGTPAAAHRVDPAAHQRLLDTLRARGACSGEGTLRRKDGTTLQALMHAHLARDPEGREVCAVSAIDITEHKRAAAATQASLAEKEVLLQEIHHRVKNNLQVVSSLLQLQRRRLQDPALREVFAEAENRVRAMALVHERLYQQRQLAALDFGDYLRGLVEQLLRSAGGARPPRLTLALQPLQVPVGAAIPLALIATELVTNALKYAWRGRESGELRVALQPEGPGRLTLAVADDGPGLPADLDLDNPGTLGLRLVGMLVQQLGAEIELGRGPGAECRVTAPVAWTLPEDVAA